MADHHFERESRTPFSEAYGIEQSGDAIGRVDIHFTPSDVVYATLCVPPDFDEEELQDLIAEIDESLVLTADPYREDFVVTVWRGVNAGVYSEEDEGEDDDDDARDGADGGGNARRSPLVLKPNS